MICWAPVLFESSPAWSEDDFSILFGPVFDRDMPKLRALLESGVNANARSEDGHTALHVAIVITQDPEAVRLLIKFGADPHARSGRNTLSALEVAEKMGLTEIAPIMSAQFHSERGSTWVGGTVSYPKSPYGEEVWAITWGHSSPEAARDAVIEECRNRGGERCEVSATVAERPCVGVRSTTMRWDDHGVWRDRTEYRIVYGTLSEVRRYLAAAGRAVTYKCSE